MNYDNLIRNWHTKASEEDYFSKYVFEYLAFIAFLKKKKYPDFLKDRDVIQCLKQDIDISKRYLEKFQSNIRLKEAWEEIRNELNRHRLGNTSWGGEDIEELKWWNNSYIHMEHQSSEGRNTIKGVIHSLDDWENMVEFWSAIRNNLFHGTIDPQDERDQLLVKNGYITIRELVEILLADEQS